MITTLRTVVNYTPLGNKTDFAPIIVRSKDGFTFPVDVRVAYHIDRQDAPKVVATVGDDNVITEKVITPAVRAIFRNNAEKVKALDYVQERSTQEKQSTTMLREALLPYGITLDELYIGDIGDQETLGELLMTQTNREIALQEQETFKEQQRAAEEKKGLSRTEQEADEEKKLATASYAVQISEQDKEKRIIDAEAEAEYIKVVAQAKADAYQLIAQSIGQENAALIEALKTAGESDMEIVPSVMVISGAGGGASVTDAFMGTVLRNMINSGSGTTAQPAPKPAPQPAAKPAGGTP
jgi:regulator of protease activity HflC (stomatin/prohibitin superfamily)